MTQPSATPVLPCLICGKTLPPEAPGEHSDHWPLGGTVFYSHGHYGSDVFDTMSDRFLEVNICGACLKVNPGRVYYVEPIPAIRQPARRSPWVGQYE